MAAESIGGEGSLRGRAGRAGCAARGESPRPPPSARVPFFARRLASPALRATILTEKNRVRLRFLRIMALRFTFAFPCPKRFRDDPGYSLLPLGLLSMAAVLKEKGHEVRVIHLGRFGRNDSVDLLCEGNPDVVGLSCFTFQRRETLDLARRVRESKPGRRPLLVIGGPHATFLAREILERCPWVDAVAAGEAEETVLELAERLEAGRPLSGIPGLFMRDGDGRVAAPPPRGPPADLDRFPSPAELEVPILGVEKRFQLRHLITGRGCLYRCAFCVAPALRAGALAANSVERVLREMSFLRNRWGLVYFSFRNDTFTADRAWTREFCGGLIEEKFHVLWDCQSSVSALDLETLASMRRAGCVQIQLGIESGSDEILRALRKPFTVKAAYDAVEACRKVGLLVSFYVITGVIGEDLSHVKSTEKIIRALRPASVVVSRLAAYPGTAFARELRPVEWFERTDESFFVRDDPQSRSFEKRLRRLAEKTAAREPYTRDELREAASLLGEPPASLLALGRSEETAGRHDRARELYERILSRFPGHPWAELALGELLLGRGDFAGALPRFERLCADLPRWPYPLDRLGWTLKLAGRTDRGEELIARARALEPLAPAPPPPRLLEGRR